MGGRKGVIQKALSVSGLEMRYNSSENLEILANQELKNINLWMVSNGLTHHPSKTQALSIAPFIHKSSPSLSLNLYDNIVNITNTAKYLGVLIDDQLSFKFLINFLEKVVSFCWHHG